MSEMSIEIYFRDQDTSVNSVLREFFEFNPYGSELKNKSDEHCIKILSDILVRVHPKKGKKLFNMLIEECGLSYSDVIPDSTFQRSDYLQLNYVFGSDGIEIAKYILKFLYQLSDTMHAQAYGHGDDDPSEYWVKQEYGCIEEKYCEPEFGEKNEENIQSTIFVYRWWHNSMPENIRTGFLYNPDYKNDYGDYALRLETEVIPKEQLERLNNQISIEDKYIVFTGKMSHGSRDEMEEYAEECGAITQKTINQKTDVLVVGDKPGKSKLQKAKEYNVRVITELDFNRITDYISFEPEPDEKIGPLLNSDNLVAVIDSCNKIILADHYSLEECLNTYVKLHDILCELELQFNSGVKLDKEHTHVFLSLIEKHLSEIQSHGIESSLKEFYKQNLKLLSTENHLGTMINIYTQNLHFSGVLCLLINDKITRDEWSYTSVDNLNGLNDFVKIQIEVYEDSDLEHNQIWSAIHKMMKSLCGGLWQ